MTGENWQENENTGEKIEISVIQNQQFLKTPVKNPKDVNIISSGIGTKYYSILSNTNLLFKSY